MRVVHGRVGVLTRLKFKQTTARLNNEITAESQEILPELDKTRCRQKHNKNLDRKQHMTPKIANSSKKAKSLGKLGQPYVSN